MMGIDRLTDDNFIMYAMKAYDNPHCLKMEEFYDDLKRIKYIKRLLNRYITTGVLKERLLINHIVILYNIFGVDAATRILFFKLERKFWPSLKTFLVYLNYMPERVVGVCERDIIDSDIPLDPKIVATLRAI